MHEKRQILRISGKLYMDIVVIYKKIRNFTLQIIQFIVDNMYVFICMYSISYHTMRYT